MKTMNRMPWAIAALVALAPVGRLAAQQQQDFSKVEIKATKIGPSFYVLEGQGGAIGVLTGPDGVFMVDSQFAPLSEKIAAAIKQISDRPIRFMVNTHVHGDHTGGDENFARMGVTIISRDELRARLASPPNGPKPPPAGLPLITYKGSLTVHMDGEDIQLIAVPVAHTDGDTMVKFPNADVIMTGDFYRSLGFPNIDRANGGTLNGMLAGLNKIVELAGPSTKIVPGHGAVVDRAAVSAHRDMIVSIRDKIAPMVKKGMTLGP